MINRTRTIESSVEIEVKAKDEDTARDKAEEMVTKAQAKGNAALEEKFNFEESSDDDTFEYEVSEA
jgi:hypothetical protein